MAADSMQLPVALSARVAPAGHGLQPCEIEESQYTRTCVRSVPTAEETVSGECSDPVTLAMPTGREEPPSPSLASYLHMPSVDSCRTSDERRVEEPRRTNTEGTVSSGRSLANLKKSQMSEQLQEAKNISRRRRIRISGVSGVVGLFFVLSATAGIMIQSFAIPPDSPIRNRFSTTAVGLILVGLFFFLLALLPTDRRAVPAASWLFAVVLFLMAAVAVYFGQNYIIGDSTVAASGEPDVFARWRGVAIVISGMLYLVLSVYMVRQAATLHQANRLLSRMWKSVGFFYASVASLSLMEAVVDAVNGYIGGLSWLIVAVVACLSMIGAWNAKVRTRIQAFIGTRSESHGSAAAVAALVGSRTVEEVLEMSRCSFYTVKGDRLKMEHMLDNLALSPMPKLARRTRLGEADAFISHSWSDDPLAKWNALQSWRKRFKEQNQMEPRLWIDKYCIPQDGSSTDMENSLACLPIYLASCSRLVVICGETYLTRLWCIIEIFVFIEMGGLPENLEVIVLPDPDHRIAEQIHRFDPSNLKCSENHVADLLHSVLEAGSGGLEGIRQLVEKRFQEKVNPPPPPPPAHLYTPTLDSVMTDMDGMDQMDSDDDERPALENMAFQDRIFSV